MADDEVVVAVPAAPPQTAIQVTVRTDFLFRNDAGNVSFHWQHNGEAVSGAQVEIVGTAIQGVTNNQGRVNLVTTNIAEGLHTLRITHSVADRNTADPVGPLIATPLANPPNRIYRRLEIEIFTSNGFLADVFDPYDPANGIAHGRIGNRTRNDWAPEHLPVDWRPVWMQSPRERAVRNAGDVALIVIHHTAGPILTGALNKFLNPFDPNDIGSAHYLINLDGHILKMGR